MERSAGKLSLDFQVQEEDTGEPPSCGQMPQGAPHPEPVLHGAQVPGGRIRHACACGLSLRSRGGVWLNCPISGDWAGSGPSNLGRMRPGGLSVRAGAGHGLLSNQSPGTGEPSNEDARRARSQPAEVSLSSPASCANPRGLRCSVLIALTCPGRRAAVRTLRRTRKESVRW